jgi:hypothetical protein
MSVEVIASITAAVITIVFGILQKFFFMHLKSIKDNQQLLLEKIAEVIANQGKFVHLTKCDADMKSCQDCLDKACPAYLEQFDWLPMIFFWSQMSLRASQTHG